MTAKPVQPAASATSAEAGRRFAGSAGAAQVPEEEHGEAGDGDGSEMEVADPGARGRIQDHTGGEKRREQRRGAPGAAGPAGASVEQGARGERGGGGEGGQQVRRQLAAREREEDEARPRTRAGRRAPDPRSPRRQARSFSDERKKGMPGRKPARKMRTK